ncbi:MAG: DnaA/Hda family protein [Hyphomicrobiales bacterium]
MTARQLTLDLPHRAALGREDFFVTGSNAAAVALVDQWPNWPSHGAMIVGPPGSGKSHLASVWQQRSGAPIMPLRDLKRERVPGYFGEKALAIEAGESFDGDETALFHALNHARQDGKSLLITSPVQPTNWTIALPDLRSRLAALPVAVIAQPDDVLLRVVLVKQFADRQIAVNEAVISYLAARMPRALDFVRQLVDAIDRAALEQGAEVTRPFAARILEQLSHPDMPGLT